MPSNSHSGHPNVKDDTYENLCFRTWVSRTTAIFVRVPYYPARIGQRKQRPGNTD